MLSGSPSFVRKEQVLSIFSRLLNWFTFPSAIAAGLVLGSLPAIHACLPDATPTEGPSKIEEVLRRRLIRESEILDAFEEIGKQLHSDTLNLKGLDKALNTVGHASLDPTGNTPPDASNGSLTSDYRKWIESESQSNSERDSGAAEPCPPLPIPKSPEEKFRPILEKAQERLQRLQLELEEQLANLSKIRYEWEIDSEHVPLAHTSLEALSIVLETQAVQSQRIQLQLHFCASLINEAEILDRLKRSPASDSMGLRLREKLRRFPSPEDPRHIKARIEDQTNTILQVTGRGAFSRSSPRPLQAGEPISANPEVERLYQEIQKKRWDQVEKHSRYLREWEEENLLLNQVIRRARRLVQAYCLWLQDCLPMNLDYWGDLLRYSRRWAKAFATQVHGARKTLVVLSLVILSAYAFLIALWIGAYPKYWSTKEEIRSGLGRIRKDSIYLTISELCLETLVVLPSAACLLLPAPALMFESKNVSEFGPLATAFLRTAPVFGLLKLLGRLGKPRGWFEEHLKFPKQSVRSAFEGWTLFTAVTSLSWFGFCLFDPQESGEAKALLGRANFVLLCLSLALLLKVRCLRINVPLLPFELRSKAGSMTNQTIWIGLISITLYAGIMAAKGFFETAKVILWNLEKFLAIWFSLLLLYRLIVRIMLLHRRRIVFERNLQQRAELLAQRNRAQSAEEAEPLQESEDPVFDLEKLSSRSLSLVRSVIQVSGVLAFLLICSRIRPIFKTLEFPIFLHFSVISLVNIGLLSYLFYQWYQNLPALLDLVIFPHLALAHNTRYVIKRISRYGVSTVGILVLFWKSQLDTQQFQFIGALFCSALGFGIRDLFNSLISGVLIMAGKSIRIGDTVNIGPTTGIVTQIGLFTTTLVDPDKKEISIPNKNLANELFSRWPSEELVHRVTLKVAVSSRFSCKQVIETLCQCVKSVPGVLFAPEETALLSEISPGHNHYEVRVLIPDLQRQAQIRSQLYAQILASMQALGVPEGESSVHA